MLSEQDPESKEVVWVCWVEGREWLTEEMHKDEYNQGGGQRCSKENMEELSRGTWKLWAYRRDGTGLLCLEEYYREAIYKKS